MESEWTPAKRDALVEYLEGHPHLSGHDYETIIAALRWSMPVSVVRPFTSRTYHLGCGCDQCLPLNDELEKWTKEE